MRTERYLGKCRDCGKTTRGELVGSPAYKTARTDLLPPGTVYYAVNGGLFIVARCCGRGLGVKVIRGKFSAAHKCGARCLAATGPNCECSCAGRNHGSSHAA